MKRILITLLFPFSLTPGMAQMDHSNMNMPQMQMGSTMDLGGLDKLRGKTFDRAFLSMMVPHHQEAIDMAKAVLPRVKDPQVKKWAMAIIKDQQKEIQHMNSLLKNLGGVDRKMQSLMQKSMSGMTDMVKSGGDRAFVESMLPHHASALLMANVALEASGHAAVLDLARDIVVAQAREMHAFKSWLRK